MRFRNLYLGLLLMLAATLAVAQATPHQNTMSCIASADSTAATPGTTNMYRSVGAGNTTFSKFKTGLPPTCTSIDTSVVSGQVTNYYFTALIGGVESNPSGTLTLTTPTFSPGAPTGTAQ